MDLDQITPDIYRAICVLFGVLLGFLVAFRVRLYRSTYERQLGDLTAGLRLLDCRVQTIAEMDSEHAESLSSHDEILESFTRRLTVVEDVVVYAYPRSEHPLAPRASRAPDTDPSALRVHCEGCGHEGGDPQSYGARCGHCGGRMIVLDSPEGPTAA
jgi:hypothetical protein